MEKHILLGRGKQIQTTALEFWKQDLAQIPQHSRELLSFMTEEHHRVRYFVVDALMQTGKPIEPAIISDRLTIPVRQVQVILDDLEKRLFFVARNRQGAVTWAYPVTVEPTPHRLRFRSGERLYGA